MNRRFFLRSLLAGVAGAAITAEFDPEKLLWTPGEKTIFLPPVQGWTKHDGNTLITIDMITREALKVLKDSLIMTRLVEQKWNEQLVFKGGKVGHTLSLRLPKRFADVRTFRGEEHQTVLLQSNAGRWGIVTT